MCFQGVGPRLEDLIQAGWGESARVLVSAPVAIPPLEVKSEEDVGSGILFQVCPCNAPGNSTSVGGESETELSGAPRPALAGLHTA